MAQRKLTITFEDIPLDQARQMSRGPRMDPDLYHGLREKIQSLGNTATRFTLPEGANCGSLIPSGRWLDYSSWARLGFCENCGAVRLTLSENRLGFGKNNLITSGAAGIH